jgi:hypothetical protein
MKSGLVQLASDLIDRLSKHPVLGRPLGSARIAVESNEGGSAGNRHGRIAIVSISQVDGNHATSAAIRAAPIAVQGAGAAEQAVASGRLLVFGN